MEKQPRRLTAPGFAALKTSGQKITMLTAYDYTMARLLDQAGVDAILVGESLMREADIGAKMRELLGT